MTTVHTDRPLFSIITVTRNNLSGLKKTANTVKAQTFRDFEWIVIDGDSDDGTQAWLKQSTAQWISEPDTGIYDAMNKGIDRAQGRYLIFMNAGDRFASPDVLEHLALLIKEADPEPALIYADALEERTNDQTKPAYKMARSHRTLENGLFTHHQAILYKHDAIKDVRYDTSYKIAADYKFTAQIAARAQNCLYWPEPVCLFESGGVSQNNVRQGRREQMTIRKELNMVGPTKNRLIERRQAFASTLKKYAPRLFWFLRQKF